jgi:hypothetical protein
LKGEDCRQKQKCVLVFKNNNKLGKT